MPKDGVGRTVSKTPHFREQQAKMIHRLIKRICNFLKNEDGPTSVEYAVVIMLILMAAIGGIQVFGGGVASSFADTDQKIGSAIGP